MIKIREFIKRVKGFISENPKRTRFIAVVAIAVLLPLVVVAALTVQNLKQKASESDVVRITDASGTTISVESATTSPYVYIALNLPPGWELPQKPSASNGLVKNAYAVNIDIDDTGGSALSTPTPTSTPKPTATPTPIPQPSTACAELSGQCTSVSTACSSLGSYTWGGYGSPYCSDSTPQCCVPDPFSPTTTLTPSPTNPPSTSGSTVTPAKHVLKQIIVENIDPYNVGGIGGSDRNVINIGPGDPLPTHFSWKLKDLDPNQEFTNVRRDVQVTFVDEDGFTSSYQAATSLSKPQSITSGSTVIEPTNPVTSGSTVIQSGSSVFTQSLKQDLDLNDDNKIDDADVGFIVSQFLKKGKNAADLTGDGIVNGEDINQYLRDKKDSAQ